VKVVNRESGEVFKNERMNRKDIMPNNFTDYNKTDHENANTAHDLIRANLKTVEVAKVAAAINFEKNYTGRHA
jgi:hypothetical protein